MGMHGTTIIGIHLKGQTVICGDGQVSLGDTILKGKAIKVRRIYNGQVIIGFAGATADAFSLLEKFEEKLNANKGNLRKSAIELAKDWRQDRILRRLEAMLIAGDKQGILLISGVGDVLEPDDNIVAIGSGGNYALAAARALADNTKLSAKEIATEAIKIAAGICVYTNDNYIVEEL